MGFTYVMSDVHGEKDLFFEMLKKINFSPDDRLIILGDVLDRGPHSFEIIKYIMNSSNIEMIKGNHERMFLNYILATKVDDQMFYYHGWVNNGGHPTINEWELLSEEEQLSIKKFIHELPVYKIVDGCLLVHSGINTMGINPNDPIEEILFYQKEADFLWCREEFYRFKGLSNHTIIFGHTPTPYLREEAFNFDIWHDPVHFDKIGIDCGAPFEDKGAKLGCLRLEDLEEYYVTKETNL